MLGGSDDGMGGLGLGSSTGGGYTDRGGVGHDSSFGTDSGRAGGRYGGGYTDRSGRGHKGDFSGIGGRGSGKAAKKKQERRRTVILTDRQQFQEMMNRFHQKAQARFAKERMAKASKYGEQYAGYAGLSPDDIAEMRADPALRGLSPAQAAAAMARATGATATPDEDLATEMAAATYGVRRGSVSPASLADVATQKAQEDRGLLGQVRDVMFDIDRTVTPEMAEQFAQAQPDFTQAPSYTAGLSDVTDAYSRGLAYTDPTTGQMTQDVAGQMMEAFGPLATAMAPALIGSIIGTPIAGMLGASMTRSAMKPGVGIGTLTNLAQGNIMGAIASTSPMGQSIARASEISEMNARLGLGPTAQQRASMRERTGTPTMDSAGDTMALVSGRRAQAQPEPLDVYQPVQQNLALRRRREPTAMTLPEIVASTTGNPYAGNIYGL